MRAAKQIVDEAGLRDWLTVVLVAPRNPLNIGAAARAMANFGVRKLTVVSPFAEGWREARSAVGAPELLESARERDSLAEAVAGATLVIGTGSLEYRKPEQPVVLLLHLAASVREEVSRGGQVAIVFGPENHGLSREDLSLCHAMAVIPTDERQPSMNLGQAVAVVLYELVGRGEVGGSAGSVAEEGKIPSGAETPVDFEGPMYGQSPVPFNRELEAFAPGAASGSLELLAGVIEETMERARYSPAGMREANRHDLRLLLRRLGLREREVRRILGVFRRILWALRRGGAGEGKTGPGGKAMRGGTGTRDGTGAMGGKGPGGGN